jgi:hypothetical protein
MELQKRTLHRKREMLIDMDVDHDDAARAVSRLDEVVDRHTAARILGVSPRTLDRWHLLRIGPPRIKIGNVVRYRASALCAWLRDQEQAGPRSR